MDVMTLDALASSRIEHGYLVKLREAINKYPHDQEARHEVYQEEFLALTASFANKRSNSVSNEFYIQAAKMHGNKIRKLPELLKSVKECDEHYKRLEQSMKNFVQSGGL